jgi:fumarate hydratase class II
LGTTLREAASATGFVTAEVFDKTIDPAAMVGQPDRGYDRTPTARR